MLTIDIDFEVFKALTARRQSEAFTVNDVIRALLKLPSQGTKAFVAPASTADDWFCKGVRFPVGTELRASYKGAKHTGVIKAGKLLVNGQQAFSPSNAASMITGNNINGWRFWEARLPGQSKWQLLDVLRPRTN